MAHEIHEHDGLALALNPAWHGLGTVLDHVMTAKEAIKAGGLDWQAGKDRLYRYQPFVEPISPSAQRYIDALTELGIPIHLGKLREMKKWVVTVREDLPFENPASDLGCVNDSYTIIDNAACFDACDRLINKIGAFYESAGSLFNGKQVFLLARFPKDVKIGDDVMRPFLLLSTAHDGSKALELKFTTVRVVCNNTLSAALSDARTATVRVKHTAGAVDAVTGRVRQHVIDSARQGLAAKSSEQSAEAGMEDVASAAMSYVNRMAAIFNQLAEKDVTRSTVRKYLDVLVPAPMDGARDHSSNKRNRIQQLYWSDEMPGQDLKAMRLQNDVGTMWRLYNAVTHYNDHIATSKQTLDKGTGLKKSYAEARFTRIMSTAQGNFRDEALNILTEVIDHGDRYLDEALIRQRELREQAALRLVASN